MPVRDHLSLAVNLAQVDLLCNSAFPPLIPLSLAASAISHGLVSTSSAQRSRHNSSRMLEQR